MLKWVLELWSHRVKLGIKTEKAVQVDGPRVVEQGSQTDLLGSDLASLQDQIMDLKYDLNKSEEARLQAERERDDLAAQLAEAMRKHGVEKDEFLNEIARLKREAAIQLAQKDQELKQLQQQIISQQDAFKRAEAAWLQEKQALEAKLRSVQSDLQQALTEARRMQLLCEKLKKECGQALKDRIAALIADLEAAKNKLKSAIIDRDKAMENADSLHRKLSNTQRKMELERQFLPLLHLARGPLGQQNVPPSKTSNSKSEPKLPSISQPEMLQ